MVYECILLEIGPAAQSSPQQGQTTPEFGRPSQHLELLGWGIRHLQGQVQSKPWQKMRGNKDQWWKIKRQSRKIKRRTIVWQKLWNANVKSNLPYKIALNYLKINTASPQAKREFYNQEGSKDRPPTTGQYNYWERKRPFLSSTHFNVKMFVWKLILLTKIWDTPLCTYSHICNMS